MGKYIIFLALVMTSCTGSTTVPMTEFSGDHTTPQIRGMWASCYKAAQAKGPMIPPSIHVKFCDCMTDTARRNYSAWEYKSKKEGELTDVFKQFGLECKNKVLKDSTLAPPVQTTIL